MNGHPSIKGSGLLEFDKDKNIGSTLCAAVVVMKSSSVYRLSSSYGTLNSKRAFSCLTVPEVGDHVLVCYESNSEDCYILSVLERDSNEPHRLETDHDLVIANNELTIESKKFNIKIDQLDLAAKKMELDSKSNQLKFDEFAIFGLSVKSSINSIRAVYSIVDQTVKHLLQKAKFVERKVSEAEIVHAEELNMKINNTVAIKSKQTNIQSSEYVNITSDLINMS